MPHRHSRAFSVIQIAIILLFMMAIHAKAQSHGQEEPMSAYQSQRMTALEAKHDLIISKQEALSDRVARIEGIGVGFGGVLVLLNIVNIVMKGQQPATTRR